MVCRDGLIRTCLCACFAFAFVGCAIAPEGVVRGGLLDVATRGAPVRLRVEERGHGEPILMLHGFGSSTYTWRHIAPPLARSRRVVAVDLKGAGRSDIAFDGAYGILDQVALKECDNPQAP